MCDDAGVPRATPTIALARRCGLGALLWCACTSPDGDGSADPTTADAGATEATTSEATTTAATGSAEDTASGPAVSVVGIDGWQLEDAAADPWAAERPVDADCTLGWGAEDGVFEVDTQLCTFGTFVQGAQVDIAAGDELELVLIHDALYSPDEGALAHLAVAVAGQIAWETEIEIPALQNYLRPVFAAPVDAPAGTPIHFHVHNHGYNNYRVVDLTVR